MTLIPTRQELWDIMDANNWTADLPIALPELFSILCRLYGPTPIEWFYGLMLRRFNVTISIGRTPAIEFDCCRKPTVGTGGWPFVLPD